MVALDIESIDQKQQHIRECVKLLKTMREQGVSVDDKIRLGAVKHYLIMAIEAILDICNHILVEELALKPASYEDIIVLMGKEQLISADLSKRSAGIGKFRNKLIHEYMEVDDEKVLNYFKIAPEQFEEFDKALLGILKNKKIK